MEEVPWRAMSGILTACSDPLSWLYWQEDITITEVTVFVNPYTEEDEEEGKGKEEAKELSFQEQQELVSAAQGFSSLFAPTPFFPHTLFLTSRVGIYAFLELYRREGPAALLKYRLNQCRSAAFAVPLCSEFGCCWL